MQRSLKREYERLEVEVAIVTLVVGGVPEHFNLPWRVAAGTGYWPNFGVDVRWREQPGGTGQMLAGLQSGDLDMAVLLTEGIVKRVANGLPAKIVAQYISSPLQWGIHVGGRSRFRSQRALVKGAKFAITRVGSGSHLMGFVTAQRLGFRLTEDRYVVVETLDGAREALQSGAADILLWDRFMLSPLVHAGELRRLGVEPTPWPSFVIAASEHALKTQASDVRTASRAIAELAQTLRYDPRTPSLAVKLYGLREDETAEWLRSTRWDSAPLSVSDLNQVQRQLRGVGILKKRLSSSDILATFPKA